MPNLRKVYLPRAFKDTCDITKRSTRAAILSQLDIGALQRYLEERQQ